jgi:glutamyl-tRNA synthetase
VRGPDITVRDLIKGEVVFPRRELADFVLLRADETPVYNFAVVVDDIDMGVTHVIRGEDHLSNTPKHMLLFEAFGVKPPAFAHLPIILGPDGSKLSKRHGAVSVREYRRRGYLPEAILNFVILLGWSPVRGKTSAGPTGQEEIISLNEMVERFRLEEVSRHPAIFDTNKLDFFNGWYLRHLPLGELADRLLAWYRYVGKKPPAADEYLLSVLATLQERLKRLEEFPQLSSFYFAEPSYEADLLVFAKSDPDRTRKGLVESLESLASLTRWSRDDIQAALEAVVKSNKLGNGDVFWPVRVAVTGLPASPPPVDVLVVLGKERSLARLRRALRLLSRQKSG